MKNSKPEETQVVGGGDSSFRTDRRYSEKTPLKLSSAAGRTDVEGRERVNHARANDAPRSILSESEIPNRVKRRSLTPATAGIRGESKEEDGVALWPRAIIRCDLHCDSKHGLQQVPARRDHALPRPELQHRPHQPAVERLGRVPEDPQLLHPPRQLPLSGMEARAHAKCAQPLNSMVIRIR